MAPRGEVSTCLSEQANSAIPVLKLDPERPRPPVADKQGPVLVADFLTNPLL